MRWLVCSLLLPLSASAASVLLVPVDEKARVLADELIEPFGANKLTVKMAGPGSPALNCLKDPAREVCLGNIGEKAKVVAVFVVSGALKGSKGTLTLEMSSKGTVLKKDSTRVTRGKVKTQMRGPLASLLKLLPSSEPSAPVEPPKVTVTETQKEPVQAVEPAPAKVADAPKKTEPLALTPTKSADPLALTTPAPKQVKPKVAAWVMTGLAIAAAGTAATFGGLGLSNKAKLETVNEGISTLSYNEAVALQQTSNTQLTVALGTGIGAGVTGVLAGILWGVE
ncbi:MAG: hypothetical protein Q8N23_11390 [Archangium sp.]|nr:hypothetical protein [Archangium sp.]MDP3569642.1 hypothetical protein [Archangium sp.]